MVNLFSTVIGFSCFFKSREDNTIKIDNVGFRLHYGFTAGFLFLCTALLGLTDMFGKNIQCRDQGGYYVMSDTNEIIQNIGLSPNVKKSIADKIVLSVTFFRKRPIASELLIKI